MVAQHKFFKLHWKTLEVEVSTYFKVDWGFILYFILNLLRTNLHQWNNTSAKGKQLAPRLWNIYSKMQQLKPKGDLLFR